MQQIVNFVLKNSNRLLFLLLLVLSISLTIQSHSYHKSKIISSANFFTGGIYERINNVDEYFGLRKQNEELAQENARLKSLLFNLKDTTKLPQIDSIKGLTKAQEKAQKEQEKLEWSDYIIKIVNMWEYFLNNGLKDINPIFPLLKINHNESRNCRITKCWKINIIQLFV